jgi:succinyl-CoA synthetase beta subunit
MKIHEHQAKDLLRKYKIAVPKGAVAFTVEDAEAAAEKLIAETESDTVVVKAQIHAGGRGKGGGVKVVKGAAAAAKTAKEMLGMTLVTHQTGPVGKRVERLLIEQGMGIAKEFYVGMVTDRETRQICLMASTEGGMEIEEVAAKTPEKIIKQWFDPMTGLLPFKARRVAFDLGFKGKTVQQCTALLSRLSTLFLKEDASLVEINPLVLTDGGEIVALDAKLNFDDNALFRHADQKALQDPTEVDPVEAEAAELGFSYVSMDGNIGCCVNGAGLAMATMDIIKYSGGEPANFLDVGGGADTDTVRKAFKIILSDDRVKAIFVNIFGGILRCDVLAEGVVGAVSEMGITAPLVVRLEGTKVDEGKAILAGSKLDIVAVEDMGEGARKVVALAAGEEVSA